MPAPTCFCTAGADGEEAVAHRCELGDDPGRAFALGHDDDIAVVAVALDGGAGSGGGSRARGPSHVLKALRVADGVGTLRLSFSRETTDDDVAVAARVLVDEALSLR